MFSCRPRVEPVAAGSRSRCGSIGGTRVSLRGAVDSPPQTLGLRPLKGLTPDVSYRLGPHVLRVLELLLLVVVPLGQDVQQQQITENRGLGARRWWLEPGNPYCL